MKRLFSTLLIHLILPALLLFPLLVNATDGINSKLLVEFHVPPSPKDLRDLKAFCETPITVSLFDSIANDYFRRLYMVENSEGKKICPKEKLQLFPKIRRAEEVFPVAAFSLTPASHTPPGMPNDPFFPYQWGLLNQGQSVLEEIDDIHSRETKGVTGIDLGWKNIRGQLPALLKRDVVVAIIDSGVDLDHPDLKENLFRNEKECDRGRLIPRPTEDRDGNGYKGDCMGWNFLSTEKEGDHRPYDEIGHGTHVAGIISASINNKKGTAGLSPRLKILPIRVLKGESSGGSGSSGGNSGETLTDRIAKAVLYAIKMKVDVINMSLGWPILLDTEYLRQTFALARAAKISIVAAAGNNGNNRPPFPCAYEGVLCVGSVSIDGQISPFSNYGGTVDILAPGDQILSLFPEKLTPQFFSVKGYEIKNGTSQAAPFVSAVVGLLKGIFPGIGEDEIYTRVVAKATSLPPTPGKYGLGGLISLEKSLSPSPEGPLPSVYPHFKELSNIILRPGQNRFSLVIPLKNYGGIDLRNVTVEFSTPGEGETVLIDQKVFSLPLLQASQSLPLRIEGEMTDLSRDNAFPFQMKISFADGKEISHAHEILVIRSVDGDSRLKTLPLLARKNLVLATKRNNQINSLLKTVTNKDLLTLYPEYYATTLVSAEDPRGGGMDIHLLRYSSFDHAFKQEAAPLFLPKATQLVFLSKWDMNADGKGDYFLGSLVKDGDTQYLQYSYFDQDLKPLFGPYVHFKFQPETAFFRMDTVRFLPEVRSPLGKYFVPYFLSEGKIPAADKNPDPWEPEDTRVSFHLYYLSPKLQEGKMVMETRMVDNKNFRDKIRKNLNLRWNEDIDLLHLLPQSEAEKARGELQLLVSVGRDFKRKYYKIILSSPGDFSLHPFSAPGVSLDGSLLYPVVSLKDGAEELGSVRPQDYIPSAFITQYGTGTIRHSLIPSPGQSFLGDSFVHEQPDKTDALMGHISSFLKGQTSYVFLQSKKDLILLQRERQGPTSVLTRPIQRFSFLPGSLFNELFFPIFSREGDEERPALYVDATQIYTDHLYILVPGQENQALISPIRDSIQVPKNCKAINPVPPGPHSNWSFTFICQTGPQEWSLKFLEMGKGDQF